MSIVIPRNSSSGVVHESRSRKILSFQEEKAIKDKVHQLEDNIKGKEIQQGVKVEPRDIKALEAKLRGMREVLNQGGAVRLEGRERVHAEMEIKRLEEEIKKMWGGSIPSYDEHWMTAKAGIRYRSYVNKLVFLNSSRKYAELVRRWKYLRRRLEPQDSRIDSTMHLFSTR